MPLSGDCSGRSDEWGDPGATDELFVAHRPGGRRRGRRCNDLSRAELRDETLWLEQQLAISESHVSHLQERVRQLKAHVKVLERQRASEHEQWRNVMEAKEKKWTEEYDRHMQALLRIIAHHEKMHRTLKEEVDAMKAEKHIEVEASVVGSATTIMVAEAATQTKGEDASNQAETEMVCGECCVQESVDLASNERTQHEESNTKSTPIAQVDGVDAVDPIHEQYAALTMRKLLEQLRQSNCDGSPPKPHCVSSEEETQCGSFRDSVHQRLSNSQSDFSASTSLLHLRRLKLSPISESSSESEHAGFTATQMLNTTTRAPEAA